MANIIVSFSSNSATPPTLGYAVSYKRLGVDASPTFLSTNPAPTADQNGTIVITVPDLPEGYNYEITVQPKCGIDNVGTLLTFTKKLPKVFNLSRDPSTSNGACAAAGNNQSVNTLYAVATQIVSGTVLYKTADVDAVDALRADNGWYSDFSKAYNITSNGTVATVVNCPTQ